MKLLWWNSFLVCGLWCLLMGITHSVDAQTDPPSPLLLDLVWNSRLDGLLHLHEYDLVSNGTVMHSHTPTLNPENASQWQLEGQLGNGGIVGNFVFTNSSIPDDSPVKKLQVRVSADIENGQAKSTVTSASFNGSALVQYRSRFISPEHLMLNLVVDDDLTLLDDYTQQPPPPEYGYGNTREYVIKIRYPDSYGNSSVTPVDKTFTINLPDLSMSQSFPVNASATSLENFLSALGPVQVHQEMFYDETADVYYPGREFRIFLQTSRVVETIPNFTPDAEWYIISYLEDDRKYWRNHEVELRGANGTVLPAAAQFNLEISVPGYSLCILRDITVDADTAVITDLLNGCEGMGSGVSFSVDTQAHPDNVNKFISLMFSSQVGIHVFTNYQDLEVLHRSTDMQYYPSLSKEHEIEVRSQDGSPLSQNSQLAFSVDIPGRGERHMQIVSAFIGVEDLAANLSSIFSDEGLVATVEKYYLPSSSGHIFHIVFNQDVYLAANLVSNDSNGVVEQRSYPQSNDYGSGYFTHEHEWIVRGVNDSQNIPAGAQLEYNISSGAGTSTVFLLAGGAAAGEIRDAILVNFPGSLPNLVVDQFVADGGGIRNKLHSPETALWLQILPTASSSSQIWVELHSGPSYAYQTFSNKHELAIESTGTGQRFAPSGIFNLHVSDKFGSEYVLPSLTCDINPLEIETRINNVTYANGTGARFHVVVTDFGDGMSRKFSLQFKEHVHVSVEKDMNQNSTIQDSFHVSAWEQPAGPVLLQQFGYNDAELTFLDLNQATPTSGGINIHLLHESGEQRMVAASIGDTASSLQATIQGLLNEFSNTVTVTNNADQSSSDRIVYNLHFDQRVKFWVTMVDPEQTPSYVVIARGFYPEDMSNPPNSGYVGPHEEFDMLIESADANGTYVGDFEISIEVFNGTSTSYYTAMAPVNTSYVFLQDQINNALLGAGVTVTVQERAASQGERRFHFMYSAAVSLSAQLFSSAPMSFVELMPVYPPQVEKHTEHEIFISTGANTTSASSAELEITLHIDNAGNTETRAVLVPVSISQADLKTQLDSLLTEFGLGVTITEDESYPANERKLHLTFDAPVGMLTALSGGSSESYASSWPVYNYGPNPHAHYEVNVHSGTAAAPTQGSIDFTLKIYNGTTWVERIFSSAVDTATTDLQAQFSSVLAEFSLTLSIIDVDNSNTTSADRRWSLSFSEPIELSVVLQNGEAGSSISFYPVDPPPPSDQAEYKVNIYYAEDPATATGDIDFTISVNDSNSVLQERYATIPISSTPAEIEAQINNAVSDLSIAAQVAEDPNSAASERIFHIIFSKYAGLSTMLINSHPGNYAETEYIEPVTESQPTEPPQNTSTPGTSADPATEYEVVIYYAEDPSAAAGDIDFSISLNDSASTLQQRYATVSIQSSAADIATGMNNVLAEFGVNVTVVEAQDASASERKFHIFFSRFVELTTALINSHPGNYAETTFIEAPPPSEPAPVADHHQIIVHSGDGSAPSIGQLEVEIQVQEAGSMVKRFTNLSVTATVSEMESQLLALISDLNITVSVVEDTNAAADTRSLEFFFSYGVGMVGFLSNGGTNAYADFIAVTTQQPTEPVADHFEMTITSGDGSNAPSQGTVELKFQVMPAGATSPQQRSINVSVTITAVDMQSQVDTLLSEFSINSTVTEVSGTPSDQSKFDMLFSEALSLTSLLHGGAAGSTVDLIAFGGPYINTNHAIIVASPTGSAAPSTGTLDIQIRFFDGTSSLDYFAAVAVSATDSDIFTAVTNSLSGAAVSISDVTTDAAAPSNERKIDFSFSADVELFVQLNNGPADASVHTGPP